MPEPASFLSLLTGSFSSPAGDNPTVAMVEAAYRHHGINARSLNCEVEPAALGDAVRGARAMGWVGFNCSIPHKVAVTSTSMGWLTRPASSGPLTASCAGTAACRARPGTRGLAGPARR